MELQTQLSKVYKKQFTSSIKSRGLRIFEEERVKILFSHETYFHAEVEGDTNVYTCVGTIEKEKRQDFFCLDCNCPHSEAGNLCKHLWATLLTIDNDPDHEFELLSTRIPLVHTDLLHDIDLSARREKNTDKKKPQLENTPKVMVNESDLLQTSTTSWRKKLDLVTETHSPESARLQWGNKREFLYVLNKTYLVNHGKTAIDVYYRIRRKNGIWGEMKSAHLDKGFLFYDHGQPEDIRFYRYISENFDLDFNHFYDSYDQSADDHTLAIDNQNFFKDVVAILGETKRFFLSLDEIDKVKPLRCMPDQHATLRLEIVAKADKTDQMELQGHLELSPSTQIPLTKVEAQLNEFVIFERKIYPFLQSTHHRWSQLLLSNGFSIPKKDINELLAKLHSTPQTPQLTCPEEYQWQEKCVPPAPEFHIILGEHPEQLHAQLFFIYAGHLCQESDLPHIVDRDNCTLLKRMPAEEEAFVKKLYALELLPTTDGHWAFPSNRLEQIVSQLNKENWTVKAEGKKVKNYSGLAGKVKSNIDWFELSAEIDFEGSLVSFPTLLQASKGNSNNLVQLGDGAVGILPVNWLEKHSLLGEIGKKQKDNLRFSHSQAVLLDTLLEDLPDIKPDDTLKNLRKSFKNLRGISPEEPSKKFTGQLRPYQKEGLGWLKFLNKSQLGGCLADDMGLGKTIQVISLLVWHYSRAKMEKRPSLIVVPRSLVYNWQEEIERFSKLKCLDYSGPNREAVFADMDHHHLIITTYAIARRDIDKLADVGFDYVILDEAQSIKNSNSQIAKASKLLSAKHRLALTGTPIENSLNDLWSIFDFINPGLLEGTSLKNITDSSQLHQEKSKLIAKSISPFLLRRTKEKVLADLPAKVEQVIYCELNSTQKRKYNELKKYYRSNLDEKIKTLGLKKAKIHVLEALLRLRQTACHPGLVDRKLQSKHSGKTELVFEQLQEAIASGQKVLVFSQFTELLKIVEKFVKKDKINYQYLDGQSKNRQAIVDRFQKDTDCKVFLISLKAGGVGLNLTSAGYCFILDPWWNPAVEAQAIDRAHRIGQKNQVFAYKYITRGTVEEKILELQKKKKSLAKGLISENSSLVRNLSYDDLQSLLS